MADPLTDWQDHGDPIFTDNEINSYYCKELYGYLTDNKHYRAVRRLSASNLQPETFAGVGVPTEGPFTSNQNVFELRIGL